MLKRDKFKQAVCTQDFSSKLGPDKIEIDYFEGETYGIDHDPDFPTNQVMGVGNTQSFHGCKTYSEMSYATFFDHFIPVEPV